MKLNRAKIHIIGGFGKVGSWLANFLQGQNLAVTRSGSQKKGQEYISQSDLIFISVPIAKAPQIIQSLRSKIKKQTLLVDLSSVMTPSQKVLTGAPFPSAFIHFLFAPSVTSIQNQKVVIAQSKKHPLLEELKKIMENQGGHIINMTPQEHDRVMSYIQSLSHFVNISLAKICLDNNIDLVGKISTPVFLTQIAALNRVVAQNPQMLAELQIANPYSANVADELILYQKGLVNLIHKADVSALAKEFSAVHKALEPQPDTTLSPDKFHPIKKAQIKPLGMNVKVAYLGPKGTFSHQALRELSHSAREIPCKTIHSVIEAVSIGRADYGVVPAENSTEGTIRETLDLLVDYNLFISLSLDLPIHQNLLSREKDISKIKLVYSHPQALAQSRTFLNKHLPDVRIEATSSTLAALDKGPLKPGVAIVGPAIAARAYGLNTLAKNIEDLKENQTKFYLVSKTPHTFEGNNKTLLFLSVFNRVGILRDILNVFADFDLNLSKIESRPSREKAWDYHFFVEVQARADNERLIEALNVLKQYCPQIKMLGSVREAKKIVIAGPCAAESSRQIDIAIREGKKRKVDFLRVNLWKPRTRPGFDGLGEKGLPLLVKVAKAGLNPGLEVVTPEQTELVMKTVLPHLSKNGKVLVWIGARNQNHYVQREIAQVAARDKRVILMVKNQPWESESHWQGIIGHVLQGGIPKEQLLVCHRGFTPNGTNPHKYRNVPDFAMSMRIKNKSGIPMIFDPSHTGGSVTNVLKVAKEAAQYDYDGVIVEVHHNPKKALTDAKQQLTWSQFDTLLKTMTVG